MQRYCKELKHYFKHCYCQFQGSCDTKVNQERSSGAHLGSQGQGQGQQYNNGGQGQQFTGGNPMYGHVTETIQYNHLTPPQSYGYYTPPYMLSNYVTPPRGVHNVTPQKPPSKETTFNSPYKPVNSPIGSLKTGVNSPFKPVIPSPKVNNKSSNNGTTPRSDATQGNNHISNGHKGSLGHKGSHQGHTGSHEGHKVSLDDSGNNNTAQLTSSVTSEVLRQVIASPGNNRDLLTELW